MGTRLTVHDDVSPSMLIYQGLELEDLQYVPFGSIYIITQLKTGPALLLTLQPLERIQPIFNKQRYLNEPML
jgi:hypothetical protein